MNLQLLGVQKKTDNVKKSIRFVAVVNNDIIKDAEDYGFIAVGSYNKDVARMIVEGDSFAYEKGKNVFSCKGKDNKISGNYGKFNADTNYKYVTFAVNDIGDFAIAARFYVKDKNGKVYYAAYKNAEGTYGSCSAAWSDLAPQS